MNDSISITINADGISKDEMASENFKSAYQEIVDVLTAPGFIRVLCAHEAAHVIFFTIAGMEEFDPLPTCIYFDPIADDYAAHLAKVKPLKFKPLQLDKLEERIVQMARAYAAGGVVARKLNPSCDGGDSDDKDIFKKMCDDFNRDPGCHIDFDIEWKCAQETVLKAVENEMLMNAILEEGAKLRPQFGL